MQRAHPPVVVVMAFDTEKLKIRNVQSSVPVCFDRNNVMHFLPLAHDPAGPAPLAKTARLCEFYATNPPPRNGLIKAVVLLVIFSLFFHDFF